MGKLFITYEKYVYMDDKYLCINLKFLRQKRIIDSDSGRSQN